MALYIQTNTSSINAQRDLNHVNRVNKNVTQRLASGLRINSAADDPANLQVSNRMTSQINGLKQGNRNTSDGQALINTAEGALCEEISILQRIRVLALQSANGTYTQLDRDSMQQEVNSICNEITRIAYDTTFGGAQILNGANNGLINQEGNLRIHVGAQANCVVDIKLDIAFSMSALHAYIGGLSDGGYDSENQAFDISSRENAEKVIAGIDDYIRYIDSKRAELGAVSNRFDSTLRNQDNIHENQSFARSQIRDSDYAEETSRYIQNNTMTNASTQILVQANARPEIVAALLS
ncbi:flagellin [Succinivibrio sp.]|uniref:flagellin N-terminal helical domain-containing protein n=1 Tax=Succinivibrio sp. TaxID=2053619 RepID=UPI0038681BFD